MTSLSENMEKFITKWFEWIEQPPTGDSQWMEWLSWDGILSFFTNAYSDPMAYLGLTEVTDSLDTTGLSNNITQLMMPLIQLLQG